MPVVAFTDEIERQLVRLEELSAADVPAAVDLVDHAVSRLRVFLDEIANGAPPVPLTLFDEFEAMQKARGVEASAQADLFYPDLNVRAPRCDAERDHARRAPRLAPVEGAPAISARPARMAARRGRAVPARCARRSRRSRT